MIKRGNLIAVKTSKKFAMKNFYIPLVTFIIFCSCNSSTNSADKNNHDSTGLITPADSITPPSGVVNSSAISTDTAAINVQNTIKKADSAGVKKK